jgi:hypothetical protein
VRIGRVASADGSLTMIMLGSCLEGYARWRAIARASWPLIVSKPEANGTRPVPSIESCRVLPSQRRPSMASHLVQPPRPLPTASLLPFLLRPPQDHRGQPCPSFCPQRAGGRARGGSAPSDGRSWPISWCGREASTAARIGFRRALGGGPARGPEHRIRRPWQHGLSIASAE